MHVLVTAGPTREYVDAVRFLSNASSGKLGFACARAAAARGHRVTLVTGPVDLPVPPGIRVVRVGAAEEMRRAVLRSSPGADAVIMTAAVGDYRPEHRTWRKLKKSDERMTLRLVRTRDILAELGRRKRGQILVGFALEVQRPVQNALRKMREKRLDLIVLNRPGSLGAERMSAVVFGREGELRRFRAVEKRRLAQWLVREVERRKDLGTA